MKKYSNLALCQRNIVKAVCSNSPGHPQRLLVLSVFMKNYIIEKVKNKFKCCNVYCCIRFKLQTSQCDAVVEMEGGASYVYLNTEVLDKYTCSCNYITIRMQ